jgi:hypothetical protein
VYWMVFFFVCVWWWGGVCVRERDITNPSQAKGHQLVHARDVHV